MKTLQASLSMQVLLLPLDIKTLNENHIYSSLPKETVNPAPPDLNAFACRKNWEMCHSLNKGKHTGQTKHDSQNIFGCVRLSDLVKTHMKMLLAFDMHELNETLLLKFSFLFLLLNLIHQTECYTFFKRLNCLI